MAHPAQLAAEQLRAEVNQALARPPRPGTQAWFLLQAKGCSLSMLNGLIACGAHNDPQAAEAYRKSIVVKYDLRDYVDDEPVRKGN